MKNSSMISLLLALSLSSALAPSCSDDDGTGMTLADYLSQSGQMACQMALECCTSYELGELYNAVTEAEVQACADQPADVSDAVEALYQDSLDNGWIEFDPDLAADCLAVYEIMTCEQFAQPGGIYDGLCEHPLVPQQNAGDPCKQGYECVTGYCDGGSMMSEGVCGEPPQAGEECSTSCAEGFWCDFGTCEEQLADGEPCFSGLECLSGYCFAPEGETDPTCGILCDGK